MPLSDEKFQERLAGGKKYERIVVKKLIEAGISVDSIEWDGGSQVDARRDKGHFAKHDKDIVVNGVVLEVKSRRDTCVFTGPEDFPFPDIFIDTEGGWEAKVKKPKYYVVISQNTGGALVIPGDTREEWTVRKVWDKDCGFATRTLVAPAILAKSFDWMVEELRESINVVDKLP